jgi:hypothetical protein
MTLPSVSYTVRCPGEAAVGLRQASNQRYLMKRFAWMAVACSALMGGAVFAEVPEQSYTAWKYSDAKGYYYCQYFYKSSAGDAAYKEQFVIFSPKDPNWVYWCNPSDNPDNKAGVAKFWGRCPTKANPTFGKLVKEGKDVWSVLPDDKKKSRLADLVEEDFPVARVMSPPIPGSKDPKRTIYCPPDPPNLPN